MREVFAELNGQHSLEMYEHVYATGEPISQREFRVQLEPEDSDERIEIFVDFSIVPIRADDGAVTGVIGLVTDVTDGVQIQQAAQQRAAEAEQRYAQARDLIDALQRELLPAGVPVLPGVQIAASYLLADADTSAGGDWFDAPVLPDGRVALVVGDVVGHGVSASAVMGQLRVLLSERLLETGDVIAALATVDRVAERLPGARSATACVALLDPRTGTVTYCTAGHPPPLVVSADGRARYLPVTGAGPLGLGGNRFTATVDRLGPADLLLLYTDGILERPGRDLPGATVELARAAADIAADRAFRHENSDPAEQVATQTLELLTRITGHTDDITLLAAQRVPEPPALRLEIPTVSAQLTAIRQEIGEWLAGARVPAEDTSRIQHALGELITNALEHAYIDSADPHTVTVTAELTATGDVTAQTIDGGRWREPKPSADRGLGLTMTTELVDALHIDHGEHGTTVTLTHRLSRPARLLSAGALGASRYPAPNVSGEPFLLLDQPSAPRPRLRGAGPVDASPAPSVSAGVRMATAGGTRSLTLDLTGVTYLASAGIATLYRLAALSRDNNSELRFYAPPGSPADMILTLVQLPHVTTDPDNDEQLELQFGQG
jgi:serine phosphatase RsbU (regulator of sigma subunit)/anti-sigma regulatory factor (Ser/Thr protein kinase)/anti-anti-sigma regulatory factor